MARAMLIKNLTTSCSNVLQEGGKDASISMLVLETSTS